MFLFKKKKRPAPESHSSVIESIKSAGGSFRPGLLAALCGVAGTGLSLGVTYLCRSGVGAESKFIKYIYALVFERGNIQFITLFLFWLAFGLILEKRLYIRREVAGFADGAIREFQEKATSGDKYGATTVLGLLETFESSCTKFGQSLPVLYNRILQGLKQAKISTNQGDVANVLTSVESVDYEKMESSYNMIRFLIWMIPSLGFVGTLIGMSDSIGSFQGVFEYMNSASISATMDEAISGQLNRVTSGLALAFDTTLLALILSALLNFLMTGVLRREENLLVRVNDFVLENIINRFSSVKSQLKPVPDFSGTDREETRHQELLKGISEMKDKLAQKIQNLEYGIENLQSGQGDSVGKLSDRIVGLLEGMENRDVSAAGAAVPPLIKGLSSGKREAERDSSGFADAIAELNRKLSSLETLPEIMDRLADSQKDLLAAMADSTAEFDLSPLANPLEELNRNLVHNAEAIAGLRDFKEHLEFNSEKMVKMNDAINELVKVNNNLGRVMSTLIKDAFTSGE